MKIIRAPSRFSCDSDEGANWYWDHTHDNLIIMADNEGQQNRPTELVEEEETGYTFRGHSGTPPHSPNHDTQAQMLPTQVSSTIGATANPVGQTTALIGSQDLAQLISNTSKDNFSKAQGLLYFCGGYDKYGKDPIYICEPSVTKWIGDIENRTRINWSEMGRIELCKQYALGAARTFVISCIQ